MRICRFLPLALVSLSGISTAARAQAAFDPNDPDVQEMMSIGQTMFQRMNDAGIDMQSLGQQFQDGTLDPDSFQQMLRDKGVIDDALESRMQKTSTKLALNIIKQALNSTDEEWTILLPKLQKVVDATAALGPVGMGLGTQSANRGFGMMGNASPDSPVIKALNALKAEIANTDSNNSKVGIRLDEYRKIRDQARKDLLALQDNLKGVLTIRQEGILVALGILQ